MSFQSKTKFNIKKDGITNEVIEKEWMKQGFGYDKRNLIVNVSRREMPTTKKNLSNMQLFNSSIGLPYKEFRGFVDSGNLMCVPETILHHLKCNGRHKKLKLNDVIDILESNYDEDDPRYDDEDDTTKTIRRRRILLSNYDEDDESDDEDIPDEDDESDDENIPDEECPTPGYGERGYTSTDIMYCLDHFKCRGRLLDVNLKEFVATDYNKKNDKHIKTFLGIVYNNHLYYCTDSNFVMSMSDKARNNNVSGLSEQVYDKKKTEDKNYYEVIETDSLLNYYLENYDNTIRLIKTCDGKITTITYDTKVVCANPDKSIMKEILGDTFHNENLTIVGEKEFKDYFPNHITSSFTKDTFDQLEGFKHGNYVRYFNHPRTANLLDEYDINKCRTSCWLDNKLGSYEVFDCTSQVEVFDGTIKKGLYKIQCLDDAENFFVRGNTWYSGDFIQVGMQEGFKVLVNYQLLCKKENCLKATYFKEFVQKIINKYPNHYKHLINTCIGYRGKTNIKKKVGYIETD